MCALVRQGLGLGIVNPLTALELVGEGMVVRPLSVSIPFHVALIRPSWRTEHPLRADFEAALAEAADGPENPTGAERTGVKKTRCSVLSGFFRRGT